MSTPQMKKRLEEIARERVAQHDALGGARHRRPRKVHGGDGGALHSSHQAHSHGGSFASDLSHIAHKANDFAKKTHIVSHASAALGHPELAAAARSLGYGLKKLPHHTTHHATHHVHGGANIGGGLNYSEGQGMMGGMMGGTKSKGIRKSSNWNIFVKDNYPEYLVDVLKTKKGERLSGAELRNEVIKELGKSYKAHYGIVETRKPRTLHKK